MVVFIHIVLRELIVDKEHRIDDVLVVVEQKGVEEFGDLEVLNEVFADFENVFERVDALEEDLTVFHDDLKTRPLFGFVLVDEDVL